MQLRYPFVRNESFVWVGAFQVEHFVIPEIIVAETVVHARVRAVDVALLVLRPVVLLLGCVVALWCLANIQRLTLAEAPVHAVDTAPMGALASGTVWSTKARVALANTRAKAVPVARAVVGA